MAVQWESGSIDDYELQYSGKINELIPVTKYRSKRTGLRIVVAEVEGPLVNGYFCLATEAHDDDGLPHTLEHLVFLGSEDYPYKYDRLIFVYTVSTNQGVLDLLANRCLASGTNAWTDTDHTCYTITTAGSDGFLNLMPVYLDHILYPTLTDSGYRTEVHHINGEGDDAGVVYCEMQARENTGESRTHLALLRAMYPGVCGYKSETGGILHNLRTSTSHAKVVDYHRAFYRPENLYLVVTGMVKPLKVLERIQQFEEKIISKGPLADYQKPWQSPVPPLVQSVELVEKYPSDEEESGMVLIGWRGPLAQELERMAAIMILMEYLTDTAISPLQRDFVELNEPYCSEVSYAVIENSESCVYLEFENVPVEKLKDIKPRLLDLLNKLSSGVEKLDMSRMHIVLHRHILEALDNLEDTPHNTIAFHLIGDFLYGNSVHDIELRLNQAEKFRQLDKEPQQFWIDLLQTYFYNKNYVIIIGEPSEELMREMGEEEKNRIAKQIEDLGKAGLVEKAQLLEKAIEENEREASDEVLTSFEVPDVGTIQFHSILPICNHPERPCEDTRVFPIDQIPIAFELDDMKTNFISMIVLMNTTAVPSDLKPYLPLYLEVILESPVLQNGVLIPYEDVINQLSADTLYNSTSLGAISGRRFRCGDFSTMAVLALKVEMEKYNSGVHWMRDLLYGVQFTADRVHIIANKMINDVAALKRDGEKVAQTVMSAMTFNRESNYHVSSMLRQHKFLTSVVERLSNKDDQSQVLESLEKLRSILTRPSNVRVHMAANVEKLVRHCGDVNPAEVWIKEFVPPGLDSSGERPVIPKDSQFVVNNADSNVGMIVGVGSVESSYLKQCALCVSDYDNPDIAAIMVYIQYLTQLEGPMWKQIRGQGLAYHYHMTLKLDSGTICFVLHKSAQLVEAYQEAKKIVTELIDGAAEFNELELIAAKSSLIFSVIEEEESPSDASLQSMLCYLRGIDQGYNRQIIQMIPKVTVADLLRIGVQYIEPLFDSNSSRLAVCCHPTKVAEVCSEFNSRFGRQLKVIESLDDPFLSQL